MSAGLSVGSAGVAVERAGATERLRERLSGSREKLSVRRERLPDGREPPPRCGERLPSGGEVWQILERASFDLGTFQRAVERAGRHLRHDALDGRARGGPAAHAAVGRGAGGIVPHVLVPALRLCASAWPCEGGRGGSGAGVL